MQKTIVAIRPPPARSPQPAGFRRLLVNAPAARRFRSTRGDRHPTSRNPAIGIRRCGPPLLDAWHQRSRPHLTQAVTQSTSDVPARGCSEPGSLHIVPRAWRVLPAHFSHEGVFPPDTGCSEPGIPHIVPQAWRVPPAHFSHEGVFPPDKGCSDPGIPHMRTLGMACPASPSPMRVCSLRSLLCVTRLRVIADAFTVVALLQPGGGYLAGRRSQCAMYSLPLRSLCRCSRRQSARRDPAVPCVLCSAHTRVSASPARTSRCRVWPPHRVHGLASRAVYKET